MEGARATCGGSHFQLLHQSVDADLVDLHAAGLIGCSPRAVKDPALPDLVRGRMPAYPRGARGGAFADAGATRREFRCKALGQVFSHTLSAGHNGQALRDVDTFARFSPVPRSSLPRCTVDSRHVALVYLLHPMLGHVAPFGALVLFALGLWNEQAPGRHWSEAASNRRQYPFAELSARNAGQCGPWACCRARRNLAQEARPGDGSAGRGQRPWRQCRGNRQATRFMLQIAILGIGAWLVIQEQTTAGVMIAASIIMGRGLAPVEAAIGGWRGFLHARQAHQRLSAEFGVRAQDEQAMPPRHLPGHSYSRGSPGGPPDARRVTVRDLNFRLDAGTCLGITGPSAAGKSPRFVRLAVGVWRPMMGVVRLDGVRHQRLAARGRRAAYRLSAPGHRAVSRHGGREHRTFWRNRRR